MSRGTRIVRVIDDGSDARIDASKRCDQIPYVHVIRPVIASKTLMRRGRVCGNSAVGNDASKLAFPGMAVSIHKTRDDDGVPGIDHFGLRRRLQLRRHRDNLLSLDQYIALHQVADLRIHTDHRTATQQQVMVRSRVLPPLAVQCAGILRVLKTPPSLTDLLKEAERQSECRTVLQKFAPISRLIRNHSLPRSMPQL